MSVYAIIWIVMVAMSFGIVLVKHGQPREDYNIFMWLFTAAINIILLYFGGFFKGIY